MKRLVEFPLQEGGSVVVQLDEPDIGGTVRAARGDTIVQATETLEDALNKVLPAARSIVEKLEGMRPNEIEMTFGISLSFKADDYWSDYPPCSAAQLARVLRFARANTRSSEEDWRTPLERRESAEAVVA